jgi:glutamate carboxypeptidase
MFPELDWIDSQRDAMASLVTEWANLNTGTRHLAGLEAQCERLEAAFEGLGDLMERIDGEPEEAIDERGDLVTRPLGPNLRIRCRREAPLRVLLAIHMDTVYGPDSPFQSVERIDAGTLRGPGVADAKGGLVIMLYALRAFERFVQRTGFRQLGWDVLINSDEEIGSPGSRGLFRELAGESDLGLLFEPALPEGHLASARKGSGNFSIRVRGRGAHAGREFHKGRNAVVAAAEVATLLHQLNDRWNGVTVNVARIDGGGPNNIVPDVAVVRFNVRYVEADREEEILQAVDEIMHRIGRQEGFVLDRHGDFSAPPKEAGPRLDTLLHLLKDAAGELGLNLAWRETGGVCDGNRLAGFGLMNVDTLGARGGQIHSLNEYVLLESLPERARLTALLLMHLAEGRLVWPFPRGAGQAHRAVSVPD